jgi:hypothetical protein
LATSEPEQALQQSFGSVGSLKRIAEKTSRARIAVGVFALEQIESARDGSQEIIEIVCDAAGKLPKRLEFLRFMKLRHGFCMLSRTLLDALLEIRGKLVQLLEPSSRLILPAPASKR